MNTPVLTEQIAETAPGIQARIAGAFYLLTILMGCAALFIHGRWGLVADLAAASSYVAVTLLFYFIFKPVNRSLSLLAAFFSLAGITAGATGFRPQGVDISFVLFGFYCLLVGYLIFKSTFLPRLLGVLMACASVGWLTFLSPELAHYLYPANLAPGLLGETSLCLWLLVMGVNAKRWERKVGGAGA